MLPKKYRLKKSGDIRGILKSGRTHREGFLILKIRENNLSNSRFAFLISLKISKKATVRNKLKRKLSKFIRINLSEIKNNIDAVLIVASDFSKKNSQETEGAISNLFQKAKLYVGDEAVTSSSSPFFIRKKL
ncbi:MAG: ribonuclease P protein component [Candidatus Nealsonbacteria bacterium RIFCSPLOWO2_01_FULL_41_9]|uniref:Ribonuclease P protein component n=1 Tax=Candidatus Nealsonbacteria bacterium RIFCSPLOWO2_01_FULL_41_9 TaxID=1801671 RepID=A0A1G2EEF5_9BACT|nr:MAG: ribonuclease P protein component [Candidatus Nealsonbacteria bacterium RIFCSPLOWO2_01_FULL_41_9]